mmetsp:Transcript_768/g.925  ORF Transcript_768/g.925 Transcript_768/m.925 type:complete len:303 (-) Transcript_768:1432-2340(-)
MVSSTTHVLSDPGSGWRIQPILGKELGVVAEIEYDVGDLIMSEKPIFTCQIDTSIDALTKEIEEKIKELEENERRKFFALSDCHVRPETGDKPTPLGIFQTNSHPCGFNYNAKRSGILPFICRINHSCCPNATHSWNEKKGEQMIYASKPIQKGEEITVTYRDNFGSSAERVNELKTFWNFLCDCPACLKGKCDTPEFKQKDKRRIQLKKLDSLIYKSISSGSYDLGISFVEKRLALLKEEGEDTPKERMKSEYDAYQACCHSGDEQGKKKWLRKTLRDALLAYGPDYRDQFKKELVGVNNP